MNIYAECPWIVICKELSTDKLQVERRKVNKLKPSLVGSLAIQRFTDTWSSLAFAKGGALKQSHGPQHHLQYIMTVFDPSFPRRGGIQSKSSNLLLYYICPVILSNCFFCWQFCCRLLGKPVVFWFFSVSVKTCSLYICKSSPDAMKIIAFVIPAKAGIQSNKKMFSRKGGN